ncbi:MAG TPA: hypothetical protein VKH35_08360 [Thermoanaerobaculia bacterium]|nr:hypothetical protein [Thermoanaerobaculia bacterium]
MKRLVAVTALVLIAATTAPVDVALREELHQAASAADLPRFESALDRAHAAIDTMKLGKRRDEFRRVILAAEDIDRVWTFAMKARDGMFYDDERLPFFYDHLANRYPDYPKFIAEYRVIDRSGLPQYPTRETRDFLLRKLENTGHASP